eukprot:6518260-Alexandrium_andersonii.AAC.1
MLVVLLPPVVRINTRAPQVALSVFADDRNALGDSPEMRVVRDTWRRLEACTCLRSNDAKTCTWQVRIVDGRPVTEGAPAKALG